MATTKQWLAGCGIGCLILVLLTLGLGAGGFFYVKNQVNKVEAWQEQNDELLARLDDPEDYAPAPDGTVAADRLELFLEIRGELAVLQAEFDDLMSVFPRSGHRGHKSFATGLKVLRALPRLLRTFGDYQILRNRTLLDRGMDLGEYYYIHTLAYHSWLDHSPFDGPWTEFELDDNRGGAQIEMDDDDFGQDASMDSYNEVMRAQLRNQLAGLPPVGAREDLDELRRLLAEQIERLDDDRDAVAWADGLPAITAACLEPYRSRFADSYDPVANAFDLWISRH